MKRLPYLVFISLVIAGCGTGASMRPTAFPPCSGPGARFNPNCHPTNWPPPTPPTATPTVEIAEARVVEVVDVDTIKVRIDGMVYTVRYAGIDCTETKHPSGPQAWLRSEAAEANKALVEGQTVLLEKGISDEDQDGRLLRYVYVGETFVNLELIKFGFARESLHPADGRYAPMFIEGQNAARKQKLGLWSAAPTP